MQKKIVILLFLLFNCIAVSAAEISVLVTPEKLITSNNSLHQEGDYVNFIVTQDVYSKQKLLIAKNTKVIGLVTSKIDNDFTSKPAKIYIEQFHTQNVNDKNINLSGIAYKEGNEHKAIMEIAPIWLIRGGEVWLRPHKDIFTLYYKEQK